MKRLTFVATVLSWLALSFPSLPARASVPCRNGTVSTFSNGSVAQCIIEDNVDISTGVFSFSCLHGQYISFDEQARLTSCILSTSFNVSQGSSSYECLPNYRVNLSYKKDGNQFVDCH